MSQHISCDCCGGPLGPADDNICAECVKARQPPPGPTEYLLVTDKDSKILQSGGYNEMKKLAGLIRRGGGEVTIFKSTKG